MRKLESFFWGIIAALGALVFQLALYIAYSIYSYGNASGMDTSFSQLFMIPAFIAIGAFVEESFKYLIISKQVEMFSQERSYITNSLFVGFGFFITEICLISLSAKSFPINSLWEIAIVHIGTAGIMGYIVAIKNPKKISTFFYAVMATTFLHSIYNLLIIRRDFMMDYLLLFLLATIIIFNVFNLIFINRKLAQH